MAKENSAHRIVVDCIYEALIKLMDEKPYKEITITDITKKAGVSRMAYYRNYQDKDDILIDHFKKVSSSSSEKIKKKTGISQKERWRDIIRMNCEDSIFEYIIKAGLFEKTLDIQLNYVFHIYQNTFGFDMANENTKILIYRKLGGLWGCMSYLINHKENMSADTLADHLIELMEIDD